MSFVALAEIVLNEFSRFLFSLTGFVCVDSTIVYVVFSSDVRLW